MPRRTVQIAFPGAQTEAGRQRLLAAAAKRDQVDHKCFKLLRDMSQNDMCGKQGLLEGLKHEVGHGTTLSEATDCAEYYAERIAEVLQQRLDAAAEFSAALQAQGED
jgi:hypothetical protein